jgi:hypothetical protein
MALPLFTQACLVEEASNMNSCFVGVQEQMLPSVYPKSCPCSPEMPGHCMVLAPNGLPLQQCFPQEGWTTGASLPNGWLSQPSQMNGAFADFLDLQEWGTDASHNTNAITYCSGYSDGTQWSRNVATEPAPGQWNDGNEKMQPENDQKALESRRTTPFLPQQQQSEEHASGQCKPCAWFWRPQGCHNGKDCQYCHLCPEGELKLRKRNKVAAMKLGAITPLKTKAGNGWGLKLDSLLNNDAA